MMTFGEYFKGRRIASEQTLNGFCRKYGFYPSTISRMERGRMSAPKDREAVLRYAACLQIPESDRQEFCDLASISAGRIPPDLTDAEVAKKLPVLFGIGRSVSEEKLRELAELIRKS